MGYVDKFEDMDKTIKNNGFEIVLLKNFIDNNDESFLRTSNRTSLYNLIYITKGNGSHEIDFIEYSIKEDDLIIVSRNRVHRYVDYKNLEGYIIKFTEGFMCEYLSYQNSETKDFFKLNFLQPHIDYIDLSSTLIKTQLSILMQLNENTQLIGDNDVIALALRTFIKLIVTIGLKEKSTSYRKNELFLQFVELVEANITVEKTVEAYADMMHVSKKTVNLMTRNAIDMSAKQYIIQQLVLRIKLKLSFEQKSIHEISEVLGFTEPSNMTRFFKKYGGVSPREFRVKVRSNNRWISDEDLELNKVKQALENNVYHITSNVVVPLHDHQDLVEIFYCIKGSGYGILEEGEVEFSVGQSFIAPAGVMHSLRSDKDLYVISVLVPEIKED